MITTRNIDVNLDKGKLKLRHITTKDIDAGVRVEPPKEPVKTKSITTTTLADVADIAEKKRRDDIAAEKKLTINKKGEANKGFMKGDAVYHGEEKAEKKSWKLMTDDEKKIAIKERTAKMLATKARKKKER